MVQTETESTTEIESETKTESITETEIESETETESTTEIESETETESTTETENGTEAESVIESSSAEMGTTESVEDNTGDAEQNTYTISDLDTTMYASKNCNVRVQPSIQNDIIGSLLQTQEIHVTGKVNEVDWYRVSLSDGVEGYVSASLLSSTKPTVQVTPAAPSSETIRQSDERVESWEGINPVTGDFYKDGDITPSGAIHFESRYDSEGNMILPDGRIAYLVK